MTLHESEYNEKQQQASEPDFYGKWRTMETAPKDGTNIYMATPWGVTIGSWVDESPQSDCGRAIQYEGWQSHDYGETQPGHNMGDDSDKKQQCAPVMWMKLPPMPDYEFDT